MTCPMNRAEDILAGLGLAEGLLNQNSLKNREPSGVGASYNYMTDGQCTFRYLSDLPSIASRCRRLVHVFVFGVSTMIGLGKQNTVSVELLFEVTTIDENRLRFILNKSGPCLVSYLTTSRP
eukprot:c13466_g1_i2.p1 GENE.c13466_g1_i2~~c13466_g1_i2.p1  ORF type:complete len:122 (-),score=11.80 c13466_g1_i2:56-421(-)